MKNQSLKEIHTRTSSFLLLSPSSTFLPLLLPAPTTTFPSSPLRAKMMRQIGSKSGPKRIYRKRSKRWCSRRKKRKKIDASVDQKPPQQSMERWRSWTEREGRKSRLGFEAPKGREREREKPGLLWSLLFIRRYIDR